MRIAVISPFLDRHHGTERCIIEQLERFPLEAGHEVHIYCQRIQDVNRVIRYKPGAVTAGRLFWHKVPSIPGPHLLQYLFWFYANTICRQRDARKHGLRYDVVYSPGINASDADAIAVHAVFSEFHRKLLPQIGFGSTAVRNWPQLIHRRLYYRRIMALEKRIYGKTDVSLIGVSALVSGQLNSHFQRPDARVIHHGVDTNVFSVSNRVDGRGAARKRFGLGGGSFVFLLIANDLKNKGLDALLGALADLREFDWKLLVVGDDASNTYKKIINGQGAAGRVLFLPSSADVLQFYAAADAYVGPSLQDAFGMPVLEAMACGLPVVCSRLAGVSELVSHGKDGIILGDPEDTVEMATALRSLLTDRELCQRLGAGGSANARKHSWDRNAEATWGWLREVARTRGASVQRPRIAESSDERIGSSAS